MELMIPKDAVHGYNAVTNKKCNIYTDSPEEYKSDDYIIIKEDDLFDALANTEITPNFIKKLIGELVEDNETLTDVIVSKALQMAAQQTTGSTKSVIKAAKDLWNEANYY